MPVLFKMIQDGAIVRAEVGVMADCLDAGTDYVVKTSPMSNITEHYIECKHGHHPLHWNVSAREDGEDYLTGFSLVND